MGSEWQETGLEQLSELIVDCPHSTPEWTQEGVVVLRNQYIRDGRLDLTAPSFTTEEDYQSRIKRAVPTSGDLVLTREAPMGEVCQIPEGLRCCLGQRMVLIRPNTKLVDPKYLLFALQSPYVRHQIGWNEGTGTTVSNIRLPNLKAFQIPTPSLAKQKLIASILGTLDDKIELNRQINTTLESMAQALFKSWFVDFDPVIDNALAAGNPIPEALQAKAQRRAALGDARQPLPADIQQLFPRSFVFNEEMGWVPEGWSLKPLSDMMELIGGGTPKTSIDEYWEGDIPWFSVVDAPSPSDVFVVNTEKYISPSGLNNSSAKLLPKGTTIISARGTVGKCAIVARPMTINQSCYGIRGKDSNADYFTYYTVLRKVYELQQRSHGSVFSTITRDTFKGLKVAASSAALTQKFDALVAEYLERILKNIEQSFTLRELRDRLLPKLLSGQLQIPEAEQQLAEVI